MIDSVVDARGLTRRFGQLTAVQDVSFQIRRAAIFGLLGPNGSGKSTIIRMLLGILPPSEGEANVLSYDVRSASEQIKRRVGYMSQQFSLYGDLSVRENLAFYGRIYGLSTNRLNERIRAVMDLVSMTDRLDQRAATLSGGWKQRLALACALIHEPELLFLDEPTAGIDPVARRHLWDLLFQLASDGVTLLVTTHYMDEAERCTDIGYIYMSRLLMCGQPEQLKRLPEVTPIGMRRFELRTTDPARHLKAIRSVEGVADATLFGETLHLLVTEHCITERLVKTVTSEPEGVELRPITPSLEDVFVTLTQRAEQDSRQTHAVDHATRRTLTDAAHVMESEQDHRDTEPIPGMPSQVDTTESADLVGTEPTRPAIENVNRSAAVGRTTDGMLAVMVKEFAHIRRQPATLFFMLVVPVMQTVIFGYAIDTQIEHIPLVVLDHNGRSASRRLVEAFVNTRRFHLLEQVQDEESFHRALTSGRAKVGLRIPPDYSDSLVQARETSVQVLIDGSDSQVATTAMNTANLLGLNLSMQTARQKGEATQFAPARGPDGNSTLPITVQSRLLYNPNLESAHFFVPGLIGIILQLVTLFLTSFAVVRERELGTLEQLFVTPVGRSGLLLGKLSPYAIVGFVEVLIVILVMLYVFHVPIHGSIPLLLVLSMLFMVCSLGLGLLVSTVARTQLEAVQFAFVIMLPSVLLSGFVFPRSEMPVPIYLATFAIPVTYFIEILRGIVLRGADLADLVPWIGGLTICCLFVLWISIGRFRKQLSS